jgi:hypothetical protein
MTGSAPINAWIRGAAGREPAPAREVERPIGDGGIGRGGTCNPLPKHENQAVDMNRLIRRGARLARTFATPHGVHLDAVDVELDHLLGRR